LDTNGVSPLGGGSIGCGVAAGAVGAIGWGVAAGAPQADTINVNPRATINNEGR
jgi:hypothetical protein